MIGSQSQPSACACQSVRQARTSFRDDGQRNVGRHLPDDSL